MDKKHPAHRILLMDDEQLVLDIAAKMISKLGYDACCTINGEDAFEIYKKCYNTKDAFSLVIIDLTVPGGMNGVELMKLLINYDKNIKAIVSSGYTADPVIEEFKTYGFIDFIIKPFSMLGLKEKLNKYLG